MATATDAPMPMDGYRDPKTMCRYIRCTRRLDDSLTCILGLRRRQWEGVPGRCARIQRHRRDVLAAIGAASR